MALESKKSDRFKELSVLIHKSLDKLVELKVKQREEMEQFEESEVNAIEEKQKRLHYESKLCCHLMENVAIRIEEIRKEIQSDKDKVGEK